MKKETEDQHRRANADVKKKLDSLIAENAAHVEREKQQSLVSTNKTANPVDEDVTEILTTRAKVGKRAVVEIIPPPSHLNQQGQGSVQGTDNQSPGDISTLTTNKRKRSSLLSEAIKCEVESQREIADQQAFYLRQELNKAKSEARLARLLAAAED